MVKFLVKKFTNLKLRTSGLRSLDFIIVFIIILIQLILVSVIFFQNKELKKISQKVDYNVTAIREQRDEAGAKIDSLQNSVMRVMSQIYRLQGGELEIR